MCPHNLEDNEAVDMAVPIHVQIVGQVVQMH
jgi:hypothetical protein